MSAKQAKLKPHVLESLYRLRRFIELDAPSVIIGREVCLLFKVTLSAYGAEAGMGLLDALRGGDLAMRGVCENDDCIEYVERPHINMCDACINTLELGLGLDTKAEGREGAE